MREIRTYGLEGGAGHVRPYPYIGPGRRSAAATGSEGALPSPSGLHSFSEGAWRPKSGVAAILAATPCGTLI